MRRQQVKSGSTPEKIRVQIEDAMQGSDVESTALTQVRQAKNKSIQDQKNLDFAKIVMMENPTKDQWSKTVVKYDDGHSRIQYARRFYLTNYIEERISLGDFRENILVKI